MKYHIQEATLEVPDEDMLDRSVNILTFGDPKKPFSVVVTRDCLGGLYKNIEEFLKKQMHHLSHQEEQFKEHDFKKLDLVPPGNRAAKPLGEAVEIFISYQHEGRNVYQRIVAILLPKDQQVLSIAGTFTDEWPESMYAQWRQIISSLALRS